jgi:hypothetical protein
MNNTKRFTSVILVIALLLSVFSVSGFASSIPDYTMNQDQWDAYWEANKG